MGIIFGPNKYEKLIIKDFFGDLINEKKCFSESVIDEKYNYEYHVYYCDKKLTENIIKNNFPTLYFEIKIFNKTFELTYKDLFREKNGKLYFLVYFKKNDYSFGNYFLMGKLFLKKYFFTFNQDMKMIGYYKEEELNDEKNDNNSIFTSVNNTYLIIIMIILIIIFGVVGFFLGKIVYDKVRKKRINEVDDNYDYFPQENINDNNDNNNDLIINENE